MERIERIRFAFVDWVRQLENEDLYYDLLSLKPVMMDSLLNKFDDRLREMKASRLDFAEALDQLGVNFCVRKREREIHIPPITDNTDKRADEMLVLDVMVLKETSLTPLANFEEMSDSELNSCLEKVGVKPMGRRKAIATLTRIYEATHPERSESTPLVSKVNRVLLAGAQREESQAQIKARETRFKRVIAKLTELPAQSTQFPTAASDERLTTLPDALVAPKDSRTERVEQIRTEFLEWVRHPENEDLYYEFLSLKPVMMGRLLNKFDDRLREMKATRLDFAEALDQLGVNYCVRKQQQEIHIPSIDNTDKRVDAMWDFYRSLFRLKFK